MHQAIIIETVRSLWTWLWGRYHVPQNVFLVLNGFWLDDGERVCVCLCVNPGGVSKRCCYQANGNK